MLRNTRRAARRHSAALARLPDRPADHDTPPDFADDLVSRMEDAERLARARQRLRTLRTRPDQVRTRQGRPGLSPSVKCLAPGA